MTTCIWATETDKNDLIDFIDYVFSKSSRPHDFATLLPKLYGKNGNAAPHHLVVREEERIAATMVVYPVTMHIAGEDVLTYGIGSVSVHPRSRGKGYMTLMMNALDALAAESGAVMAVLGGQRQRYEYFGFEKTGLQLQAQLNAANVRHGLKHVDPSGYAVVPMTEEHVPAAHALHSKQPCYCHRSQAQFLDILRSWQAAPFAVLKDDVFVGFGVRNGGSVDELQLLHESHAPAALKLLVHHHGTLTLCAAPWEAERAALLTRLCESFHLAPDNQYKFYQPEKVQALLRRLGGTSSLTWQGFTPSLPLYIPGPDRV